MRIAGLDPGRKGVCLVVSEEAECGWYHKLEFNKGGQLEWLTLMKFLEETNPALMVMEKPQGRGGMGATSTFNFGFGCGEINATVKMHARAHSMAIHYAMPQNWQKVMHEGIAGKLDAKAKSKLAYENLFPHLPIPQGPKGGKIDDNIIDALLMATFGVLRYGHGGLKPWALEEWNG